MGNEGLAQNRQALLKAFQASLKARPGVEYINLVIFRPLGFIVARALLPTRVKPEQVVIAHTGLGLLAAGCLARGWERAAAVLLQVVTVLDNADGQLARLRQQESELGRYLDTELDTLVNTALFAAIGYRTRGWRASLAALSAFTGLLSWDFNLEYLYRVARGEVLRAAVRDPDRRAVQLARAVYRLVFAPQDAMIRWLEELGLWLSVGHHAREERVRRSWWHPIVVTVAANLGRSTQYLWLGIFAWRRRLHSYPTFVLSQLSIPLLLTIWRWSAVRRQVSGRREGIV
jgi:phosphatidylglycerophosphate synthase